MAYIVQSEGKYINEVHEEECSAVCQSAPMNQVDREKNVYTKYIVPASNGTYETFSDTIMLEKHTVLEYKPCKSQAGLK